MLSIFQTGVYGGRFSRREILRVGGLGTLGVSLPTIVRAGAPEPRAKACILIYLFGGPSQLETFDLKPEAPLEFRGDFRPIQTSTPGIEICEHLPLLARQSNKFTLVRSMTHEHPRHGWGLYFMMTGKRHSRPDLDAPPTPDDHPGLGALVNYTSSAQRTIPAAVTLPRWNKFNDLPDEYAGEKAGFLGRAYDPWLVRGNSETLEFDTRGLELPQGVTFGRLADRRRLLGQLDSQIAQAADSAEQNRKDALYRQALAMVTSPEARRAFDLGEESTTLRTQYGMHPMGQGLLLARRLVEAGTKLVTVNWHNDNSDVKSPFWDTHRDNFSSLKDRLLPPTDRALAALLEDLQSRGLLESTLVVVMGEFGRTPRIGRVVMNAATDATGRDHWPHAYSVLMAGGGTRGGHVHGASDDRAAHVVSGHITPPDLVATILWSLGIDTTQTIADRIGRPQALAAGAPVEALFA